MSDIHCPKCHEASDASGAGNGEMHHGEWRRFVRGEGCPWCAFGANVEAEGSSRLPDSTVRRPGRASVYREHRGMPACYGYRAD